MKCASIAVFLWLPAGCCRRCRLPSACPVCRYGRGHAHPSAGCYIGSFPGRRRKRSRDAHDVFSANGDGPAYVASRRGSACVREGFIRRLSFIKCFINSSDEAEGHVASEETSATVQICPAVSSFWLATRPIHQHCWRWQPAVMTQHMYS